MKRLALLVMLLTFGFPAIAQTLKKGIGLYQTGQFDAAIKSLSAAYPRARSPKEKAEIMKYLGLNQLMLGRDAETRASFAKAKQLDPTVRLRDDEALDPRALELFNKQGEQAGAKTKNPKTTLLVKSNVKGTIFVDGIIVGQTDTPLEMNPGKIQLSVEAPGYQTFRLQTQLKLNQSHNLSVTLKKIEKARPAPKVAAKVPKRAEKSKKKNDALFADEPPLPKFKENPTPQGQPQASGQQALTAPQSSVPQQSISGYQLPPQLGQQQQPYYGGGGPVVVQPQIYIQPYAGPQPYGQGYSMPQQQPYMMPSYPGDNLQPPPPPPSYAAPPAYNEPPPLISRQRKVAKKAASESQDAPFLVKLLPFGIPQFYQGSYLKGGFFLISQGLSLYFWKANNDAAAAENKAVENDVAEIDKQLIATNDQTEIDALNTKRDQRIEEGKTYIDKTTQNANLSLGLFVGSYALNVLDAFVFSNDSGKATAKKKKSPRFRAFLVPQKGGELVSSYRYNPFDSDIELTLSAAQRLQQSQPEAFLLALKWEL